MEKWRDIDNATGYQVSDMGNVRNSAKGRPVKLCVNSANGYVYAKVRYGTKYRNRRVHRLVAETFIPNVLNKPYVNHKDGNKQNNKVSNLEWCTAQENVIHARDVLGVDFAKGVDVAHEKNKRRVIRSDGTIYNSIKEAKADIGNPYAHIIEVCQGKLETACGYGWHYYE